MKSLSRFFHFLAPSPIKKLKAWKAYDEDDDWAVAAIDQLGKNLKKEDITMLVQALEHPSFPSDCVPIRRNKDGRIQVKRIKARPHEVYCRIWRWADLQTYLELESVGSPRCQYPWHDANLSKVCINPYHYRRIEAPILPPVLVPRYTNFPYTLEGNKIKCPWKEGDLSSQPGPSGIGRGGGGGGDEFPCNAKLNPDTDELVKDASYEEDMEVDDITPPEHLMPTKTDDVKPIHFPEPKAWLTIEYHEGSSTVLGRLEASKSDICVDNLETRRALDPVQPRVPKFRITLTLKRRVRVSKTKDKSKKDKDKDKDEQSKSKGKSKKDKDKDKQPQEKVGKVATKKKRPEFPKEEEEPKKKPAAAEEEEEKKPTEPEPDLPFHHFSLKKIKRRRRTEANKQLRQKIGRGVHIYYLAGCVFIRNNCKHRSIFVSSPFVNRINDFHTTTVCEIPANCELKLFDNGLYIQMLQEAVNEGFHAVYALNCMAHLRISFVKGWGLQFLSNSITQCPSWMALTLRGVLTLTNLVLIQMGLPEKKCTSTSM